MCDSVVGLVYIEVALATSMAVSEISSFGESLVRDMYAFEILFFQA